MSQCESTLATRRWIVRWAMLAVASIFLDSDPGSSYAQSPPISSAATSEPERRSPDDLTLESVEELRQRLQATTDLEVTSAEQIAKYLEAATNAARRGHDLGERTRQYRTESESAQARADKLREELNQLGPRNVDRELSVASLQQAINELTIETGSLQSRMAELESEVTRRINRRQELNNNLLAVPRRRAEIEQALQAAAPENEPPLMTDARRLELLARRRLIDQEFMAWQSELAKYASEDAVRPQDIVNLSIEYSRKELQGATDLLQAYTALRTQKSADESRLAAERAHEEYLAAHPQLRQFAETGTQIAKETEALAGPIRTGRDQLRVVEQQLKKLRDNFSAAQQLVNQIGLTGLVGQRLRSDQAELLNERAISLQLNEAKRQAEQIQAERFDLAEQQKRLAANADSVIREIADQATSEPEQKRFEDAARSLVTSRLEYMSDAVRTRDEYLSTLLDLYTRRLTLIDETRQYRNFINERILWIHSNDVLLSPLKIDDDDQYLLSPRAWQGLAAAVWQDIANFPWPYLLFGSLIIGLIAIRPRLRREITGLGELAAKGSCHDYWLTVRSLFLTCALAAGIPGLALLAVWRLTTADPVSPIQSAYGFGAWGTLDGTDTSWSSHQMQLIRSVGQALYYVAWIFLPMELLRCIVRANGLAESHFKWDAIVIDSLRRNLKWAIPVANLLTFLIALFFHFGLTHKLDLVERSIFVLAMLCLMYFLWRLFHPETGVFRQILTRWPDAWLSRTRQTWFGAILILPLGLAVLCIIGYYFTALVLVTRVYETFLLVTGIVTIRALMLRFILMRRRAAHIQQARQRRERSKEVLAQREAAGVDASATAVAADSPEQLITAFEELDVKESALHSQKLVAVAMAVITSIVGWWIWVDIFPATRMLDRYEIWPGQTVSTSSPPSSPQSLPVSPVTPLAAVATDSSGSVPVEKQVSATPAELAPAKTRVTVRDLLLACLLALTTFVWARSLPGLLEILFIHQLPVDQSIRYAFKTLISYLIVLIGVVFTFKTVAIGWTQVQWLVTALTFGLAFGLQEIFANFVAGIILLLERPIRIGDVVTVDQVTGVVSRIRTRATTITNWDRQEYVIPNKEFITGRLLNWTLSDRINRVVIRVKLAYGSKVDQAKEIIYQICRDHPLILDTPPSVVAVEEFGDDGMFLTIRAFLPDMENRLRTIDELHTRIHEEFQKAEIKIPPPQRDIRIRPEGVLQSEAKDLTQSSD